MPVTRQDLREELERVWRSGEAGREALKTALGETVGFEYIAQQNFLYHPDKNVQFTFRHHNPFVSPVVTTRWDDANKAFTEVEGQLYLVYVDGANALYSKKAFRYGAYGFRVKLPDPATSPAFDHMFLGAEPTGGVHGGIACFLFVRTGNEIYTQIEGASMNTSGLKVGKLTKNGIMPVDPTAGNYRYLVKVNRASIEYWVEDTLVGIIQFSPNSDTYDVRTGPPYYLAQVKGQCPCVMPALIEYICADVKYIGTTSGIRLSNLYVVDGEPAPPRTLHPYTDGARWEGTVIDSGSLTSDRIPVAGYDKKTVVFMADQAGTLYIDVDYGDDSDDEFDSVSISAGALEAYMTRHDMLWLRLRFTPSSYPCTITRARVLMS